MKSNDGLPSNNDTSIVDPGVALASSGEFLRACASDKPAIPDPIIATRLMGGESDDGVNVEKDITRCESSDTSRSVPDNRRRRRETDIHSHDTILLEQMLYNNGYTITS